ncbi:hypothetical protein K525DRAFT_223654 [Schizophyllum commune Loenen D]|nr:hypothetical protein K525DRAFT_223654 [Schizophyllum commune Loenen D]
MRASVVLATLGVVCATSATILKREAIPDYALTYAPYTILYSDEGWWPSDISTHLAHVTPKASLLSASKLVVSRSTDIDQVDSVAVADSVTLATLNSITADAFLTSNDDVEDDPAWLTSTDNMPDGNGLSWAPATIIAADKGDFVDVFYFYFYSYNHGTTFLGTRLGNHVGDWEHSMVRFVDGAPTHVYLSAHSGGYAYTYDAVEKRGVRPVVYVADGSHANYATAGTQKYTIAGSLIEDHTDEGPFWDVALNYRGYWYNAGTYTAAGGAGTGGAEQANEGVDWLYWGGHWGDAQLPDDDPRQNCIFDIECHYVDGPTGPNSKNLGRTAVCQDEDNCDIKDSI